MRYRIQSGTLRGRVVECSQKDYVRPTKAVIRESLFNILRPYIVGSDFVDLYAGTGMVGLEALSCGAKSVTFVDRSRSCIQEIQLVIEKLNVELPLSFFQKDVILYLGTELEIADIAFCSPPYSLITQEWLEKIFSLLCLKKDGVFILESRSTEKELVLEYEPIKVRSYGSSVLYFFSQEKIETWKCR